MMQPVPEDGGEIGLHEPRLALPTGVAIGLARTCIRGVR